VIHPCPFAHPYLVYHTLSARFTQTQPFNRDTSNQCHVNRIMMVSEPLKQSKARRSHAAIVVLLQVAVTLHWAVSVAPFGRDEKRPSAALRSLALATASPALTRLAYDRFSSR